MTETTCKASRLRPIVGWFAIAVGVLVIGENIYVVQDLIRTEEMNVPGVGKVVMRALYGLMGVGLVFLGRRRLACARSPS